MCQPLQQSLEDFLDQVGINSRDLFYFWPQDNRAELENAVIQRFQDMFHPHIIAALQNPDDDESLRNAMREILLWGGIIRQDPNDPNNYPHDLADRTYNVFIGILNILYNYWNDNGLFGVRAHLDVDGHFRININGRMNDISYDCPVCGSTPVSSWTKILAAFDTRRFWIYDSRVAIALSFVYAGEYNWFIPQANNRETNLLKRRINEVRGNAGNMVDSYQKYLTLIRASSNGSRGRLEKKLFMLGGILTDYFTMTRKINNENNFSSLVNHFFAG